MIIITKGVVYLMDKNIALIDWDGTIRNGFTIIDWIKFLIKNTNKKNTLIDKIAKKFNEYDNNILSHDELANETAEVYAECLKGLNADDIAVLSDKFVMEDKNNLFSFSYGLFNLLKKYNIEPVIISGCPIEVLNSYKKNIEFKNIYGLKVNIINGIYHNNIIINPGISSIKKIIVEKKVLSNEKLALVAFGNSISDIPLFQRSKLSFVINNNNIELPSYKISTKDDKNTLSLFEEVIKRRV